MRVVFIGPPGAGKGTQSQRLVDYLGVPHLSTGDMLRQDIEDGTDVGLEAKQYMDAGKLVPDQVVIKIVRARIAKPDCQSGCLFDGFPRTIIQAQELDTYLDSIGTKIDIALKLRVSEDELVERLLGRGRADDNPEIIRKRFKVFESKTRPLIDYYTEKGILYVVSAMGTQDEVFQRITTELDKVRK